MDGENSGKPYVLMDDLGIPLFLEIPSRIFLAVTILSLEAVEYWDASRSFQDVIVVGYPP